MQKRRTKNKRRYQRQIIEFTHSKWNPGIGEVYGIGRVWGPLLAKGRVQPAFHTHTHRHTPTDRHIVCLCTNLINRIMYTYMQKLLQLDVCLCASAVASVVVYLHMCESGSSSTLSCKKYLGKIIITEHLKKYIFFKQGIFTSLLEFFLNL